jgi:hypothetical protein
MISTGDGWASSFAELCVISGGPAAAPVCFVWVCHGTLESEKNKSLFICFKRVFMGSENTLTQQKKQQQRVMQYWSSVDLHEPIFLLVLLLRQTWEVF